MTGRDQNEPENLSTENVDLEALGLSHMARHARAATFAPNWWAVLGADALVGFVLVAIGFGVVLWLGWPGWFVVAAGILYIAMVARRALQWRWLRQQAGM